MDKICGDEVKRNTATGLESASTQKSIKGIKFVGIYFGAHWAPPCRLFTKTLIDFYK